MSAGLTDAGHVKQTTVLWKNKGENATVECSHNKLADYQMYWYRQLPGEGMKQVVFTISDTKPDYQPGFNETKFSTTKPDALSGTFTVKNLIPEDNGMYFCAVSQSAQCYRLCTAHYKNPSIHLPNHSSNNSLPKSRCSAFYKAVTVPWPAYSLLVWRETFKVIALTT